MRTEAMIDQDFTVSNAVCQSETDVNAADLTVQLLSHKWTIPILIELSSGPKRPCDLERKLIGLSAKTLAERLHHLQQNNIITRKSYAQIPPKVEYSLTELGAKLKPVISQLEAYGLYFLSEKNALGNDEKKTPNA
ncbi:MAG: winged helix-turn-helix transcriptional regulator [Candidatus Obscuribacterales bacterium]|jgi:DNA-binding HxlR family transcriptional regulator|nr:winged helix-turn-helix transcriptional regulator [Candidatus Obscuribacterales bacterium]